MNDFLAHDKGLGVAKATVCVLSFGAGCALGSLCGGFLGQRLYNGKPWLLPVVSGALICVGALPMVFLTNANYSDDMLPFLVSLMLFTGMLACFAAPTVKMMSLNVNIP